MLQLPIAYLDTAAIEEVPIDAWKEVFDAVGWPPSLANNRESFEHKDVVHAFGQDEPTDGLLQALEVLETLGTEAGREAIVSAVQDRGAASTMLPTGKGEREFALRFYIAQRKDALLADAFVRAQTQIQEAGNQRRYNEFMGKEARRVKGLDRKREALREAILSFCRKSDLGDHVQVDAFEDDGTYVFNVLRSHRTQKPLAVVPKHSARATIEFRPVHGDVIRYDASIGRLRIAARASSVVEFYREVLGKLLFNDDCFFDGNPVCSLIALQERGRDALQNHEVYGIGRVWMTECLWERGDRELFHIRSADCFRSMSDANLSLSQGVFLQAKLKCELIGSSSTRPLTVNVRVPSRIEVSQKAYEHLVDKLLSAIGIRNAAPPASVVDLWTLHPWRQSVDVWRSLFGNATDALVKQGVLLPIRLSSVPHPDHQGAGRVLEAHAVKDGDFYGVSSVSEIPSRSLTATDLDGLELAPEQFRLYLRSVLAISSGGVVWDNGELLELGYIEVGDSKIYVTYALQQPSSDAGNRLRARAAGAHFVILYPPTTASSSEVARVRLESALPKRHWLVRQAIFACALDGCVPALHIAPDGARLVVDNRIGKVWIDGVEIGGIPADSHAFKFIELLARSSPLPAEEIVAKISPGRQDGTTAARQAKSSAKQLIVDAMAAAGRDFDEDPFPAAARGFYRCAFLSFVR
jgi:hypothetical protein